MYYPWMPWSLIILGSTTGIEDVTVAGASRLHMSVFPNPAAS